MGLNVSGEEPTEGWIKLENNQIVAYSLKFDDYVVNYNNDKVGATKNGIVEGSIEFVIARVIDGIGYYNANSVKNNPVYYNPITGQKCNVNDENENYVQNNSLIEFNGIIEGEHSTKTKSDQTSCLKWYRYSVNIDETVNMILDHNISTGIPWSLQDNRHKPTTLLEALKTGTGEWNKKILNRNDKYIPKLYDRTINNWEIDYSGYNARLITAQEIANIVEKENWQEDTTSYEEYFYFGSQSKLNYASQTDEQRTRQKNYSWLFDNLYKSKDNGANKSQGNDKNYGYWTSSPTLGIINSAWGVRDYGRLDNGPTNNLSGGVRPVITIRESY